MKASSIVLMLFACATAVYSQEYPEPEFANEVYFLKKSDTMSLVRLEKDYSSVDTKVKAAGIGGVEHGYEMEGEASSIRLVSGKNLSFVFSAGAEVSASAFSAFDPTSMVTLYRSDISKGKRKIYLHKGGGYFGTKMKSSEKYSFSVKKIREGYWELVIDKPLPKGEYVFTAQSGGIGAADGSVSMYAFGIDE
jgi:hypothetical protein